MESWFTVEKTDNDTSAISEYKHWEEAHFYENCGFRKSDNSSPMFITSLWT